MRKAAVPESAAHGHPPAPSPARHGTCGWLQLPIFGAHTVGAAFGTHAAWGFFDNSEPSLFLSGFVLASADTLKADRAGPLAAARDTWRRTAGLRLVHLLLVLMSGALILGADVGIPLPGEVDRLG